MKEYLKLTLLAGLTAALAGCGQQSNPARRNSTAPSRSRETAQGAPAGPVTFSELPISPKPQVTPEFVARGKSLYEQNCSACHGARGDAKSDAAAFLLPKPRNFVEAKYRLRSTPTGNLPTDTDLFRAVSLGLPGTPMPPWKHMLAEDDRWALVEYIKTFSPRFSDPSEDRKSVVALGTPPVRNAAAVAAGRALYTKMSCSTCHGESGLGDGPSVATLVDDSGTRIKPRDFTRPAAFKSGYAAKEIVRTVLTGFDGTPMAGYGGALSAEDAWKLAYFVETFAKPAPQTLARASRNYLVREALGEPDVRIRLTERAWRYDPAVIRVKKGQIVEITFEPTDNGLGVGHGFAVSSYDEAAFINGVMVGKPKSVKFRADRAGRFTYYCSTQCSTEKLHPLMNGTLIVEDDAPKKTASLE